jgi:hypothetical protein
MNVRGKGVKLLWQNCKTTLKAISEEVLGFNERKTRNEWMMVNVQKPQK